MSVRARIAAIRLLEKMEHDEAYCKKLGLEDASRFRSPHDSDKNTKRTDAK